jgi:hypothetical protein
MLLGFFQNMRAKSISRGNREVLEPYFFFQYWVDVAGQEERERRTEVVDDGNLLE